MSRRIQHDNLLRNFALEYNPHVKLEIDGKRNCKFAQKLLMGIICRFDWSRNFMAILKWPKPCIYDWMESDINTMIQWDNFES